jgi:DNA (cytosine-5)-methyltransferase 1
MPIKRHSMISLYTGAGGLDLGLEAAGFETRLAVELDGDSAATIRANRDWPIIEADIHSDEARSDALLAAAELQEGEADLLIGGPPCQPFSKSGYWARGDARRLEDPRATTLEAYLRVLRDTQPKAFLLENVPGLAYSGKSEGLDLLRRTIESINHETGASYTCDVGLLNAADYGVPQLRQRVFIVGQRSGTDFKFPGASHGQNGTDKTGKSVQPYRTAWDAIGDLDEHDPDLELSGRWAGLIPSIPEGQNYLYHTDRGEGLPIFGWRRRYWSFLLKLAKDLPSWTIAAQPGPAIGPFHWTNRRLSARELCRIQTFPERYRIVGSPRSAQRQLGNAVPSALAEVLGLEIRKQLLGERQTEIRPPSLIPARRGTPPPPEPISPVPKRYRALVGEHSAHPGTGQGYSARKRPNLELVSESGVAESVQ